MFILIMQEYRQWYYDMLKTKQFKIGSIQCSIFSGALGTRPSIFLAFLLDRWGSKFDGQPLSVPLPNDAPPEIPRIVLTSADASLKMNVSASRIDIFWNRKSSKDDPDVDFILADFREILQEIVKFTKTSPGRLAAVISRFAPIENPGKVIAEHFCKDAWLEGPLNRPESFELHSHKKYTFAKTFKVNSWFRIKTGRILYNNSPAVIIEQDINTLVEEMEKRQFKSQEILKFFNAAATEFDQILKLYLRELPRGTA